jgi:rhamnose transport system permease protein
MGGGHTRLSQILPSQNAEDPGLKSRTTIPVGPSFLSASSSPPPPLRRLLSAILELWLGVNVKRTKFILFCLTGTVSALAGIYFTLRFGSARGDNAMGLELQVIAAVLLGGVSIFGGRGRLLGVIAGVLLIGVASSALRLQGVTVNVISIIIGLLLVLSVTSTTVLAWVSDVAARRTRAKDPSSTPERIESQ